MSCSISLQLQLHSFKLTFFFNTLKVLDTPLVNKSVVCAWREFELTNKSAEWNVFLEGFKQL